MDTFKAVYENNDGYFYQDVIEKAKVQKVNFDIDEISNFLENGIRQFKCDILIPLDKLKQLTKFNKKFIIQFSNYFCNINNDKYTISNEQYQEFDIVFNNEIELVNNPDPIIDIEFLVDIYINKIKKLEFTEITLDTINIMFSFLTRLNYSIFYKSKRANILYKKVVEKIFEIFHNINFETINNSESITLMNELIDISRMSCQQHYSRDQISCDSSFENKEYILLEMIYKMIKHDKQIKDIKFNFSKYEDEKYKESKNLYCSTITRTNWIDEIEYGNITGLLVKIDPKIINKNAWNLDFVPIVDITHTIVSLEQILEAYKIYYKANNTLFDEGCATNIISGFGIGNGNCMIPLYINEDHWKLVEIYNSYIIGIIFNRNPLISKKKHNDIYYNIASNMINLTFSNENYTSDKWIQLLFSMLRTVYEISKNDSYLINKFKNDKYYRVECNINKIFILCIFDENTDCIRYVIEELIRRKMKSLYKDITVLDQIYNFENGQDALLYEYNIKDFNKEFDSSVNNIIKETQFNELIEKLEDNKIFSKLITSIHGIISIRSIILNNYKEIFKNMDYHGGTLVNKQLIDLKEKILNKLIKPTNYLLISSLNDKFRSHINITKNKKFRIVTLKDNNIVSNEEQLKSLIIQCIIQRVNKCRKKALENSKYMDPFSQSSEIIKNTGILISSRFMKRHYGLNNFNDYIRYFNSQKCINKVVVLIAISTTKTVSLKNHILNNINSLNSNYPNIKDMILTLYNYNKFPKVLNLYNSFLK